MINKNNIINHLDFKITPFDASSFNNKPNVEDFTIRVFFEGIQIAYVLCYHESGKLYAFEVFVNEEYRRKGIATLMYNHAENISGKTINPHHENPFNANSEDVSDMALAFWRFRLLK